MPGITIGKILPEFIAGTFNRWQNKKAPSFVRKSTQEVLDTLT